MLGVLKHDQMNILTKRLLLLLVTWKYWLTYRSVFLATLWGCWWVSLGNRFEVLTEKKETTQLMLIWRIYKSKTELLAEFISHWDEDWLPKVNEIGEVSDLMKNEMRYYKVNLWVGLMKNEMKCYKVKVRWKVRWKWSKKWSEKWSEKWNETMKVNKQISSLI